MPTTPQKTNDTTDDAFAAIQTALDAARPASPAAEDPAHADLFHETAAPPLSDDTLRAANDDRLSIGQILQSLRRRPGRTPYLVAAAASVLWAAGGLAIAFLYRGDLMSLPGGIGFAAMVGVCAAVLIPVMFFMVMAHLYARAQHMRNVTEAMAEVAVRLVQPETEARDQIVSVGQAIRREVIAMGDGVERALARAGELEQLVHNEVSALERTYSENEVRMRDMLSELSAQRETLLKQADHVRNSIASVHLDLSHDIASIGDLVSDKVGEAAQRVTRTLTEKGEH